MKDTTHVLAFYYIPANKKNDLTHYYTHMPKTFEMLRDKYIVFFYEDEEILNYVKSILKSNHFIAIYLKLIDLPTYELSETLLECCKNQDNEYLKSINDGKGITHYNREYLQSGEDSYRKVITIWTSKILLMERIIKENSFNTENFAWIDVSLSRINMNINEVNLVEDKINTNRGWAFYMGERIMNSCGYMYSNTNTWKTFISNYKQKLDEIKNHNYAHDEETIVYLIYKDNPSLFSVL
jgi:hypothetical protein